MSVRRFMLQYSSNNKIILKYLNFRLYLQLFFNPFTFIRVVFSYSFCTVIELKLSLSAEQFWQTAKEKRLKKTIVSDEKNIQETYY